MHASTSAAAPRRSFRRATAAPRQPRPFKAAAAAALAAVALGATAVNAAMFEPPEGQILFGMWFDPADPYYDTPSLVNERLGFNVPVFQLAQAIPRPAYNYTTGAGGAAPESLIELSGTDAAVFLTVYPEPNGFDGVTTADYEELGKQILDYQTTNNRTTFLRFAPEMQGTWMSYGMQPTAFLTHWVSMYNTVKAIAPNTIIVWAPNTPQGYPYGQQTTYTTLSTADQQALDTNNNGELDADDDSLAPYYPGDEYVDWIGLSVYYKGIPSDVLNTEQPDGYCAMVINGTNPADGATITNWYTDYCEAKPDKACMFAEAAAAYHVNDSSSTTTEAELQDAWLKDCVVNTTFYQQDFPRIKMYMHFEHEKAESANDGSWDLRDFRVSNHTPVLNVLKEDLSSAGNLFSWGNPRATPTSISSAGAPAATNSDGQTVREAITATTRAKPTGFPSLFGITSAGDRTAEWVELGVVVAAGVLGSWSVMRAL
ncbi:hypothetical protein JCM6882_004606 [Rhodosporidiobolus microsporus]